MYQKILFERLNHLSEIVIKQRVGMYMKGSEIGNMSPEEVGDVLDKRQDK